MEDARAEITATLAAAGCVAAGDEAAESTWAAAGDGDLLAALVARRTEGEPIAWLTGRASFCELELHIAPGVYVPRWQTEPMAHRAATLLPAGGTAVDLCTGAGAIAAVMAAQVPSARVVATELDVAAVRCARANGVEVYEGSLDDPLPVELEGAVDVITAVAPYVPTGAMRLLPRDVQAYEPRLALDGGAAGTDLLLEIVRRSPRWLRPGGWLLLELGADQPDQLAPVLRDRGFGGVDIMIDEEGDCRALCARLD